MASAAELGFPVLTWQPGRGPETGQVWAAVPPISPQVPPEVWAAEEQELLLLLLLEPEEFLQGTAQLNQVVFPHPVGPRFPARSAILPAKV